MNTEKNIAAIGTLFKKKHSHIAVLYRKGLAILELDQRLKKHLPPGLQKHFELANVNKDIAVLLADSPAWATRLRYNIPAILDTFNNKLKINPVKTIRIKVKKPIAYNSVVNKKPLVMTTKTARYLSETAKNFHDPELQSAIKKLSTRRKSLKKR